MRPNRLQQLIASNVSTGLGIQSKAASAGEGVEVLIYDVIDPFFGVSSASFAKAIAGIGNAPLTVRLDSPGGDVFAGRAIASLIRGHAGPTTVVVDGLAASAASTIAMAGQSLQMARGSMLMIHCSWAFAMDNSAGLRQLANLLDKVDGEIAADYAAKAGVTAEAAMAWMQAETWFTADEAVEAKLADVALAADGQMRAHNLAAYDRVPAGLQDRITALTAPPQPDHAALRAAADRRLRLFEASPA